MHGLDNACIIASYMYSYLSYCCANLGLSAIRIGRVSCIPLYNIITAVDPGSNITEPSQETTTPETNSPQPKVIRSSFSRVLYPPPPQVGSNYQPLSTEMPSSYIMYSYFNIFCCCLWFGRLALLHGKQVCVYDRDTAATCRFHAWRFI